MSNKKIARAHRAKKTRAKIKKSQLPRLTVYRTPKHIYAQIILDGGKVKAYASTCEKEIKKNCAYGGNINAAKVVGKSIAERAKALNIVEVAFDRSGFKYHGRVQALAEAAREGGLVF